MKKTTLLLALVLLLWGNNNLLFAQEKGVLTEKEMAERIGSSLKNVLLKNPSLSFGVKTGLNYSNITLANKTPESFKPRLGLSAGFYVEQRFSKLLGLKAELLYSQKGTTQAYLDEQDKWQDIRLHYVSLPLLIDLNVVKNIHIEGGAEISYAVASNPTFDIFRRFGGGNLITQNFDLGIAAGANYRFKKLEFGVRYVHGLLPYYDDLGQRAKNSLLQASVAWQLFKK